MKPNLSDFERCVRFVLAGFLLFAALALFVSPVVRVLSVFAAIFCAYEGASGHCWLFRQLGARSIKDRLADNHLYLIGLLGIQVVMAYEWLSAGLEKLKDGAFVEGIGGTLAHFAGENPRPWYKDFLLGFATDHATAFAYAVEWSQVLIAAALVLSAAAVIYSKTEKTKSAALAVSVVALAGGALMNANFYLAAAWTGPGTRGVNVVMFWTQLVLVYVWLSRMNGGNEDEKAPH